MVYKSISWFRRPKVKLSLQTLRNLRPKTWKHNIRKKNFPKKRTDIKSESLNLEALINKLFLSNLAAKNGHLKTLHRTHYWLLTKLHSQVNIKSWTNQANGTYFVDLKKKSNTNSTLPYKSEQMFSFKWPSKYFRLGFSDFLMAK